MNAYNVSIILTTHLLHTVFVFYFLIVHWTLFELLARAWMWVYLLIHGLEVTPLKKNYSPYDPGVVNCQ